MHEHTVWIEFVLFFLFLRSTKLRPTTKEKERAKSATSGAYSKEI
jgi:hypothetical protein